MSGRIRQVWERLCESVAEQERRELATGARSGGASAKVLGEPATVVGVIREVTLGMAGGAPVLEIAINDGGTPVYVRWLGRRRIGGIGCGVRVRVIGRLTRHGDHLVIYNPMYEILPEPQ